jgi:hypothetical protein
MVSSGHPRGCIAIAILRQSTKMQHQRAGFVLVVVPAFVSQFIMHGV